MTTARERKRMRAVVASHQEYVRTYSDQKHYDEYSDGTFIFDMLYGIGIALDERYKGGGGFELFKEELRKRLGSSINAGSSGVEGAGYEGKNSRPALSANGEVPK